MTKHSKNNTASSIFSYAEYKRLDYGTKKQRLGNESMKPFDACALCLQQARNPVACQSGHLFCKECIYTDLLSQKKEIKKQKERIESLRREEEIEKEKAVLDARERVLRDFERGQIGTVSNRREADNLPASDKELAPASSRGTKRKFQFDSSRLEILTKEAEETALRNIEREQAEARKAKLPDFWLPSLTPDAKIAVADIKDIKLQTMCNCISPAHPLAFVDLYCMLPRAHLRCSYRMKHLTSVIFTEDGSSSSQASKMCPSCKKALSNNLRIYLMKPCGHVICKTCHETLVVPAMQCAVCDKKVTIDAALELTREGTGYAGGGRAETSKMGIAFQG